MSKRKRSGGRDGNPIANGTLHAGSVSVFDDLQKAPSPVGGDRRYWHPEDAPTYRAERYISGAPARVVVSRPPKRPQTRSKLLSDPWALSARPVVSLPSSVRFETPKATPICVRRQQRREVLHAKGRAGGKVSKPTMKTYSSVRCK